MGSSLSASPPVVEDDSLLLQVLKSYFHRSNFAFSDAYNSRMFIETVVFLFENDFHQDVYALNFYFCNTCMKIVARNGGREMDRQVQGV